MKFRLKADVEFDAECFPCALGMLSKHFRNITLDEPVDTDFIQFTSGEIEVKQIEEEVPPTLGINVADGVKAGDHFGSTAESRKPENNL